MINDSKDVASSRANTENRRATKPKRSTSYLERLGIPRGRIVVSHSDHSVDSQIIYLSRLYEKPAEMFLFRDKSMGLASRRWSFDVKKELDPLGFSYLDVVADGGILLR